MVTRALNWNLVADWKIVEYFVLYRNKITTKKHFLEQKLKFKKKKKIFLNIFIPTETDLSIKR